MKRRKKRKLSQGGSVFFIAVPIRVLAIFNTFENVEDYKDFFFHPKKLFFYKTFRAGLFLGSRFFFSGGSIFFPKKMGFQVFLGAFRAFSTTPRSHRENPIPQDSEYHGSM